MNDICPHLLFPAPGAEDLERRIDSDKTILFDMDGTLTDHNNALIKDLQLLADPNEPPITLKTIADKAPHIKARIHLIRSQRDWWLNLPPIHLGMVLYDLARKIGYQTHILTKGPWSAPYAWTEKVLWIKKYLHNDVKTIITEDKSLVYGRVLVDDWVPYIEGWLKHRPRGQVIMPVHEHNKHFVHERVLPYDGTNMKQVEECLTRAYNR